MIKQINLQLRAGFKFSAIISLLLCLICIGFVMPGYSQDAPESSEVSNLVDRKQVEYTTSELRDPFQPQIFIPKDKPTSFGEPVVTKPKQPASKLFSITVQGIIWESDIPMAIINNTVLKKGDAFVIHKGKEGAEEITILDIDKEGVTILYSGEVEKIPSPGSVGFNYLKGGNK